MCQKLAIAGLVVLVGCGGGGQGPAPAPSPASAALSGQVVSAPTAVAIAGATVEVTNGTNAGRITTTDPNGRYEMTGLALGTFVVTARAPGFRDNSQNVTLTADKVVNFGMTAVQ